MLTLELEPELERRARERAAERGLSLTEYVSWLIEGEAGRLTSTNGSAPVLVSPQTPKRTEEAADATGEEKRAPANLLEFLGDHVGSLQGSGEDVSGRVSELFGEYLEEKRRTGHL
jgi:hypothetical protein